MARSRRNFTLERLDDAGKLVIASGRAVATIVCELGIGETTLGRSVTAVTSRNRIGQTESKRAAAAAAAAAAAQRKHQVSDGSVSATEI